MPSVPPSRPRLTVLDIATAPIVPSLPTFDPKNFPNLVFDSKTGALKYSKTDESKNPSSVSHMARGALWNTPPDSPISSTSSSDPVEHTTASPDKAETSAFGPNNGNGGLQNRSTKPQEAGIGGADIPRASSPVSNNVPLGIRGCEGGLQSVGSCPVGCLMSLKNSKLFDPEPRGRGSHQKSVSQGVNLGAKLDNKHKSPSTDLPPRPTSLPPPPSSLPPRPPTPDSLKHFSGCVGSAHSHRNVANDNAPQPDKMEIDSSPPPDPTISKHELALQRRRLGKYRVEKPIVQPRSVTPRICFTEKNIQHAKFRNWETSKPPTEFVFFPALALELQIMIWKEAAVQPRLVRWGRAPTSGMFRACSASRAIVMQETTLCYTAFNKNEELGFYVNFERDIIYHKTRLPNLIKTSVPWGRMFNAWGAQHSSEGVLCPSWSQDAKRVAIPLDDAFVLGIENAPSHINREDLWMLLLCTIPNLEELIIMLFPNIQHHHTIEDLMEMPVDYDNRGDPVECTGANEMQKNMMFQILGKLKDRMSVGTWKTLRITFMRPSRP